MSSQPVRKKKKQSIQDFLITLFNNIRYSVAEPVILKTMRIKYEHQYYKDCDDYPLISVYIPTYNRAKLLMERAVPSVLQQTYKNFELIIVGDCCNDETEKLVTGIDDPRVMFYNLPERKKRYPPTAENHWLVGPVVPANRALQLVGGKWIARIDDDDTWTNDHLKTLYTYAYENNFEFVSGQYIEERFGKRKTKTGFHAQSSYYTGSNKPVSGNNPKIGGTSTWLYRSYLRFFKYNIHCWRKSWNRVNDIDLSLRFFKAGVRMGFVEKILSYVLPRPGESTIGLDAYLSMENEKIKHFHFNR